MFNIGKQIKVRVNGSHGGYFIRYGEIVGVNDLKKKVQYQFSRYDIHRDGTVDTFRVQPTTSWTLMTNIIDI